MNNTMDLAVGELANNVEFIEIAGERISNYLLENLPKLEQLHIRAVFDYKVCEEKKIKSRMFKITGSKKAKAK